jgi:23S rRNA (adenine2503-C2)-methyltransferase
MKVIKRIKENNIANVYIAENSEGKQFEFVESIQPPLTIKQKWVLILSTLYGCPIGCKFCDAGGDYHGKLSFDELMFQIEYLINQRFPDKYVDSDKFKIQFARMGEPSFNSNVLDVLEAIPNTFSMKSFVPSLSTIAPHGTDNFFDRLIEIKKRLFPRDFQLQFSLHSTNENQRDELIPVKKWNFEKISEYGERFYSPKGKKITLNFAMGKTNILDVKELKYYFDPNIFLIKITPVNPTFKAKENKIESLITPEIKNYDLINDLNKEGFEVILSIGELEENKIGSNCGQYLNTLNQKNEIIDQSYSYGLVDVN